MDHNRMSTHGNTVCIFVWCTVLLKIHSSDCTWLICGTQLRPSDCDKMIMIERRSKSSVHCWCGVALQRNPNMQDGKWLVNQIKSRKAWPKYLLVHLWLLKSEWPHCSFLASSLFAFHIFEKSIVFCCRVFCRNLSQNIFKLQRPLYDQYDVALPSIQETKKCSQITVF